jgi:uncharacterized protein YceH (UPF0502 family)
VSEPLEEIAPPISELTKGQRRVLGTLLEKAYTTPEGYPLTLKSLTSGCNQKSNRHPMTDYSEDDVLEIIDQLREMGLVAVVHTESGRTERYRHYMRKRFTLTEPQLAVLTELLLRGRQSVGDLRARASRMVPIESLDDLREALRGLTAQKYLQSSGSLDRRGVEVDHNFYLPAENKRITASNSDDLERDEPEPARGTPQPAAPRPLISAPSASAGTDSHAVTTALNAVRADHGELCGRVDSLEDEVRRLKGIVEDLVRDLRG